MTLFFLNYFNLKQEMGFFSKKLYIHPYFFFFVARKITFPYDAHIPCHTPGKDLSLAIKSKIKMEGAEWLL